MKILSIVGARPQFIKLASLSKKLKQFHDEIIIHTGQHFDKEMSDLFFKELEISKPDYNLEINSGNHGEQTGRMLIEVETVVLKEKPDIVIVFGDTNSTLAGALVASKLHIPAIHIEAGLRSFNRNMPEEINRIIADHTSDYLFAPTQIAIKNLCAEDLSSKSYLTGDIMVDSHRSAMLKVQDDESLFKYSINKNNYYLLTLHRPYNVDNPALLNRILFELGKLNGKIVFPVHPRTNNIINQNNIIIPSNFIITKPLGYLDFVSLQSNSYKIITDSGGIQKEAYILKKPCITLRSETEWVETVNAGWNLLINPSIESYYAEKIESFSPSLKYENIFGENVTTKMIEIINNIS
ncbi:MAG: UDP-N-acetylglucosamine 2-epimerase (non-hydrolyzing) [Ignavibacteriales bacterium]|nr:MAG: UDP-N-acetylglucosamine 2-epimerase (non-hydrolyzing) [Ignavibacteriales bacterium]